MGKDVTRSCSDAGPKPLPYLPGFNRVYRKIEEKEAEFLPKKDDNGKETNLYWKVTDTV